MNDMDKTLDDANIQMDQDVCFYMLQLIILRLLYLPQKFSSKDLETWCNFSALWFYLGVANEPFGPFFGAAGDRGAQDGLKQ